VITWNPNVSTVTGIAGKIVEILNGVGTREVNIFVLATDKPIATSEVMEKSMSKHKSLLAVSMTLKGKNAITIPAATGNKA
jgi:hypothetical protein